MSPTAAASFCVTCDAPPGGCNHNGARYLEPITYLQGPEGGWIVPQHERARWEAPLMRPDPPKPFEALDLAELLERLERVTWLEPSLYDALDAAYERSSTQTTKAVLALLADVERGGINNPAGLLRWRLKAVT